MKRHQVRSSVPQSRGAVVDPAVSAKRERLRAIFADCPACSPEDVDGIPDAKLDDWFKSHGKTDDDTNAGPAQVAEPGKERS